MTLLVGKDLFPKLRKLVELGRLKWRVSGAGKTGLEARCQEMMKHWMAVKFFSSSRGREIRIPFYAALLWDMKGCWVLKGNGISIILDGLLSHLQSNRVFPKRNQNWIPIFTMKLIRNQICPKWKLISSFHFVWSRPEESFETGSNFLRNQKSIIHILSLMLRVRAPKSTTSVIIICFEMGASTQHIYFVSTRLLKPTYSQSPEITNKSLFDFSFKPCHVMDVWRSLDFSCNKYNFVKRHASFGIPGILSSSTLPLIRFPFCRPPPPLKEGILHKEEQR